MTATSPRSFNRRSLLKTAGLGIAAAALPLGTAGLLSPPAHGQQTQQSAGLITRTVPRSGEVLPAIGLGTFLTFDVVPGGKRDHLLEVVRRFWQGGGRVFDTSPLYGMAEVNVGDFLAMLGIADQAFIANKVWSTGDYLADDSHAARSLATSQQRLWRDRMDVIQCHSLVNVDIAIPLMKAWKKEGRVRHIGITHHEPDYFDLLAQWMGRGDLDFVQVHYSIHTRQAEERVLRAAADQGVAVLVNMPLEKARLHKIVEGRPLPDFARELGITTWSQYFLKWVISNPAVTCAMPSTANPEHQAENMAALRGPLPDRDMRARMLRHMEGIPGFDKLASMPWYPDKAYPGVIGQAQRNLRGRV